jgi:hypothetical protein
LAGAPELEKRVTYSETKIPLGELVARVAADTGVPLTAARDVADEPVAVVVTDFPARELLEQLADLLDYRWSRRTSGVQVFRSPGVQGRPDAPTARQANGASPERQNTRTPKRPSPPEHLNTRRPERPVRFEIYQDLASKQREEALRRAQSAGTEQRFWEEMAICREIAGKTPEEMQRLGEEMTRWNERMRQLTPEERQALLGAPEFQRQNLRYRLVASLWPPFKRSLAGLMTRLSPEQWSVLRDGRQLHYSSDPQKGQLLLPRDVLRVFRTSPLSVPLPGPPDHASRGAPPRPGDEERARRVREQQEKWDQAAQYEVVLRLVAFDACWWDPGGIQFTAVVAPVRGGQRLGQQDEWPGFTVYIYADKADAPREEGAQRRALLEQDPVVSAKKPFQPSPGPYVDPLFPGASRNGRLLPELLPELARAYGVNFIADSYWGVSWRTGWATDRTASAGPRPLVELLDGLTSQHYQWDRRGGLIRIRDRKWFVHRLQEIPLRTIRRWTALHDGLGALPLEEYLSAATTLSDLQSDLLGTLFGIGVFSSQLNDLRGLGGWSAPMLRLYGRLSPAQRQVLQSGQPLAIAQLSPALRALVQAQLKRANRWRMPLPDFDQWGSGYLTLTRTPDVRIREQRGRAVTWRLESEPAPRTATPPDRVTCFPVTRLRMEVHHGGQTPTAVALIVAAESPPPE